MLKLAWIVLLTSACAQPDPVTSLCQRAQECNELAVGVSVQDCIDNRHQCVEQLTSNEQDDWSRMIDSCLENNSCELFSSCYANVPWC